MNTGQRRFERRKVKLLPLLIALSLLGGVVGAAVVVSQVSSDALAQPVPPLTYYHADCPEGSVRSGFQLYVVVDSEKSVAPIPPPGWTSGDWGVKLQMRTNKGVYVVGLGVAPGRNTFNVNSLLVHSRHLEFGQTVGFLEGQVDVDTSIHVASLDNKIQVACVQYVNASVGDSGHVNGSHVQMAHQYSEPWAG